MKRFAMFEDFSGRFRVIAAADLVTDVKTEIDDWLHLGNTTYNESLAIMVSPASFSTVSEAETALVEARNKFRVDAKGKRRNPHDTTSSYITSYWGILEIAGKKFVNSKAGNVTLIDLKSTEGTIQEIYDMMEFENAKEYDNLEVLKKLFPEEFHSLRGSFGGKKFGF